MVGLAIVGFLLLVIAGVQLRFFLRAARSRTLPGTLFRSLEPLNFADLEKIAKAYLEPRGNQLEPQPQAMWRLLGDPMTASTAPNAQVMLDLAVFVQRWSLKMPPWSPRSCAATPPGWRRQSRRLKWGCCCRQSLRIPFYIHEASAAYYLMRQRLLALYETSHEGRCRASRSTLKHPDFRLTTRYSE